MLRDAARKAFAAVRLYKSSPSEETFLRACEARKECRQAWLQEVEEYQTN